MTGRGWTAQLLAEINAAALARLRPAKPAEITEPATTDPMTALAGPAPCDDCRGRVRCAAGLACSAFKLYVDGAPQDRWAVAPRIDASAYRFARIFSNTSGRFAEAA